MATGFCPFFFLPSHHLSLALLAARRGTSDRVESGVESKREEENMFSLPSPQIRVALEMTEMEWSNPLGLTSKLRRAVLEPQ